MIAGVIQTRDILSHPATVISILGFLGFVRILSKAIGYKQYLFLDSLSVERGSGSSRSPASPPPIRSKGADYS